MKMPIYAHFFQQAILTQKVSQTDLVFGLWSGFISGSACARLQVSVCSSYYATLVNIQTDRHTDRQHFHQLIWI